MEPPAETPRVLELPPPPREVPWTIAAQELFGGFLPQFGWLFLGVGLIFCRFFVLQADLLSWRDFGGPLERGEARVVSCSSTGYSIGGGKHSRGTPVYANAYVFAAPDGVQRSGVSYATGVCLPSGLTRPVEWPSGRPEHSRLMGMRVKILGPSALFILVFPAVGIAFLGAGLAQGLKDIRLLTRGKLAQGRLVEKRPTNVKINNRIVYEMVFSYVDDGGQERRASTKTHQPELLEASERENLLYDPEDPGQMVTLDTLPGLIGTDFAGRLQPRDPLLTPRLLLLPGLTILGHGAWLLLSCWRW